MTTDPPRRAFTMIELVVTLLVIAILSAIAVASWQKLLFTSEEERGSALLDHVVVIEQQMARDWGSYTAWPAELTAVGSDVTLLPGGASAGRDEVAVVVGDRGSLGLAVRFAEGQCLLRTVAPLSAGGGASVPRSASAACAAADALPVGEGVATQTGPVSRPRS